MAKDRRRKWRNRRRRSMGVGKKVGDEAIRHAVSTTAAFVMTDNT